MSAESSNNSETDGAVSGIIESSIAQFISLCLSRDEYQRLLSFVEVKPSDTNASVFRRLLVPEPSLIDTSQSITLTHDHVEEVAPSIPQIVRTNSRFLAKVYLVLLLCKNAKALYRFKGLRSLHSHLTFKDKHCGKIALSLAGISFFYKIIYKLLLLLQPHCTSLAAFVQAEEEKLKIPKLLRIQPHIFTPFIAGLVSGSLFKLFPREASRDVIAVYMIVRTAEMGFNYLDDSGYLAVKPKIIGSWAMYPFALSQLFHSFFFNPETNSTFVNKTLYRLSNDFIPKRPAGYRSSSPWPTPEQVVESIAQVSSHKYPRFKAPLMFPDSAKFPDYLEAVKPILSRAHPAIDTMTGAIVHPFEPSLFRAFTEIALKKFSTISKYVFVLYLIQGLINNSKKKQAKQLSKFRILFMTITKTVRTTTFIVMSTMSAWAGIELAQKIFGSKFLPMHRYKFIGFMAGLWAFIDQVGGRGRYLFAARAAILSYWRVLVKQKRIKPSRNTDVFLFAVSFAVMMSLFERSPESVSGSFVRKVLSWVKDNKFKDPVKYESK